MMTSLYNRIENRAGGCNASPRAFIRAFRSMITPEAKTRANRDARQRTIRDMLETRQKAAGLYERVMTGAYD